MASEAYVTRRFNSEPGGMTGPLCLSVFVSAESFMYAISAQDFTHPVEVCDLHFPDAGSAFDPADKLSLLVNNYLLHQKKFEKVRISVLSPEFTLVPGAYAAQDAAKNLLSFSTGTDKKRSREHALNDLKFFYTVDQELLGFFEKTFPNASVRHAGATSISLLFSHQTLRSTDLYLHVGAGFIELAAKKQEDLLFYNVFHYNSNEDILYYLLFSMEQFALDPLAIRLSIAGERATNDPLFTTIKKYIRHVAFCVSDQSVIVRSDLAALPQHYYFTLFNQHLCEL